MMRRSIFLPSRPSVVSVNFRAREFWTSAGVRAAGRDPDRQEDYDVPVDAVQPILRGKLSRIEAAFNISELNLTPVFTYDIGRGRQSLHVLDDCRFLQKARPPPPPVSPVLYCFRFPSLAVSEQTAIETATGKARDIGGSVPKSDGFFTDARRRRMDSQAD